MQFKKLISIMTATVLASLTSAPTLADVNDTLFSNNFNGYQNNVVYDKYTGTIGDVLVTGTDANQNSVEFDGMILKASTRSAGDNTTYWKVGGENGENHLITDVGCFSTAGRGTSLTFANTYTFTDTPIVMDFKFNITDPVTEGYHPSFRIGSTLVSRASFGAQSGEWVQARLIVNEAGSALYSGSELIASSADTSIKGFNFSALDSTGAQLAAGNEKKEASFSDYMTIALDDIVIYTSTAPLTDVAPTAANPGEVAVIPAQTPSAAPVEDTVTFDFETSDTSLMPADVRGMTSSAAADTTTNGTTVLSVAGSASSSGEGRFGLSTIDLSPYTKGKSHIIIDYDAYISGSGRMTYVLSDGLPTVYYEGGLFKQGIPGSAAENALADTWIHTSVDVNLSSGTGTYTVTSEGATVTSGEITTTKQELTTLAFISWSPNTSYIDNITIQTGGNLVVVTPVPTPLVTVAPEVASEIEGSYTDLAASDATTILDNGWSAVSNEFEQILNHSNAMRAQTTDNTAITAYNSDATVRGRSVYASYDVYLAPDSEISLTPYGNGGKSQASTMTLMADETGRVTVSAITGSSASSVAQQKLVHSTWYRVLVEVPQNGNADATETGNINYTVYRINPQNPSAVSAVAARLTALAPRGLASRSLSSFGLAVAGDVYIDNAVVYIAPQAEIKPQFGELSVAYSAEKITVTDNTPDKIAKTAVLIIAEKENGAVVQLEMHPLTFEGGIATVLGAVGSNADIFVWDTTKNISPLTAVYNISE